MRIFKEFLNHVLAGLSMIMLSDAAIAFEDLNRLLDDQRKNQRIAIQRCLEEAKKLNYSDGHSIRDGLVYKGRECGGLYGGIIDWNLIGRIDEIVTTPCQISGSIQTQWTIRRIENGPGVSPQHLIRIEKKQSCVDFEGQEPDNELIISDKFYQVKLVCTERSSYDPEDIGRDCSARELDQNGYAR